VIDEGQEGAEGEGEGREKTAGMGAQARIQTGWGTNGSRHVADPIPKIRMGPQQAVAGVGTSKFGVGTKAIHTILSSRLTQGSKFY